MNQITPWPPSPPGCAPCFDPAALLQCWCDIQATTDIISKIVLDQIQTNPAYAQAIAAALAQSGAALPLVGVTNGADAQPGQVGQFVFTQTSAPFTAASQTQTLTIGVLQPGDWDVWASCLMSVAVTWVQFMLNPVPPGFSDNLFSVMGSLAGTSEGVRLVSTTGRALIAVPTLVTMQVQTNVVGGPGPAPGTVYMDFNARRMR